MNMFARLLAAGLVLGLLSPAAHAQSSTPVVGNLSVKLQGIYTPSTHIYTVNGKLQTGLGTGIKRALDRGVEVTSAGLLGINPSQVVNVGGISGCLTFEVGKKMPTETAASGTALGSLSTDNGGIFIINNATFTATLNPAGLQVILQMWGTLDSKSRVEDLPVAKQATLVHAALNVLLRRSGPLPTPAPAPVRVP